MATQRPFQPVDVATGLVAGSLAAALLTLAAVAAVQTSGDTPAPTRPVDAAVSSQR